MSAAGATAREAAFWDGVRDAGRFFMGDADVHRALLKLTRVLDTPGTANPRRSGFPTPRRWRSVESVVPSCRCQSSSS